MDFDTTGFYFLLASDEGELHDDAVSTSAWSTGLADLHDWLLRPN